MVIIRLEQLLSNRALIVHGWLEKMKKFYKYADICDKKLQYIPILEGTIVSTTEETIDNTPMSNNTSDL